MLLSKILEAAIHSGDKVFVTKAFVETWIDRLEDDIDFRLEVAILLRQDPEILSAPAFQSVADHGGSDLATRGHSHLQAAVHEPIVQKKPLDGPVTLAFFLELEKFRIPFKGNQGTIFHRLSR